MSSNELTDREDLRAFRDRIGITKWVDPVRTPEGRRRVTDIQLDQQASGLDVTGLEPLSLNDIFAIRDAVKAITVNDTMRDLMTDAEQKLFEAGVKMSQRRKGQSWKLVKAHAWANGRTEVIADDFLICQHSFWSDPDDRDKARQIVLDFASVATRKAARLREALEPVMAEVESLKAKLDATVEESERDDLLREGFTFLRQLRKLRKEAREQVEEIKSAGQDTTMIEGVLADLDRSHAWTERALAGDDA
jgi:MoxR-like ATPase